jgi:hypothetical protein
MEQIADWLTKLGVAPHAQAFADNEIDFSVLPSDRYAPKGPRCLPRSSSDAAASHLRLWRSLGCRNGTLGAHTDQINSPRRRRVAPAYRPVETLRIKGRQLAVVGCLGAERNDIASLDWGRQHAKSRGCAPRPATREACATRVGSGRPTTFSCPSTDAQAKASAPGPERSQGAARRVGVVSSCLLSSGICEIAVCDMCYRGHIGLASLLPL